MGIDEKTMLVIKNSRRYVCETFLKIKKMLTVSGDSEYVQNQLQGKNSSVCGRGLHLLEMIAARSKIIV